MSVRWLLRRDDGQSSVEFALVIPLFVVMELALAQVGLVVVTQLSVIHGTREAARALAIDADADARALVERSLPIGGDDLTVERWFQPVDGSSNRLVHVVATAKVPLIFGGNRSFSVSSTVTMISEH